MFYGQSSQETRRLFFQSWQKYLKQQALSTLEQQLVNVINDHPEYHVLFEADSLMHEEHIMNRFGELNPFLHMGLHLAIRDQIAMDRPVGVKVIYSRLLKKYQHALEVEHAMMDVLAHSLWEAQRQNSSPDEEKYLANLTTIL